jgi:hypothetical protein
VRNGFLMALLASGVCGCGEMHAGRGTTAAQVDSRAVALLKSVEDRLTRTPAYELEATTETLLPDGRIGNRTRYKIRFQRPKLMRLEMWSRYLTSADTLGAENYRLQIIDAERNIMWGGEPETKAQWYRTGPAAGLSSTVTAWDPDAQLLYAREWNAKRVRDQTLISLKYLGQREWNGSKYDVVQWVWREKWLAPEDAYIDTTEFYVAPDHTIRRIRTHTSKGSLFEEKVSRIVLDAKLTRDSHAFELPRNVEVVDYMAQTTWGKNAARMVGTAAPSFAVPLVQGDTLRLRDQLAKKRATVIFTWFYG